MELRLHCLARLPTKHLQPKKGKRDKTNLTFKKVPILTMCTVSAEEFYVALPYISVELRRYEGRNNTVMPVLSSGTPINDVTLFKKNYKAHINLQGHLTTCQLGGNPLDLEKPFLLRRMQADKLLPDTQGAQWITVQDALLRMRISDDKAKGEKRYAVYGLAEDDHMNYLLTFSGGQERRTLAEVFESHPISYLFFHFVDRFWPPDVEEWLSSAFIASDVKEQFENSVFDGKVVEFTKGRSKGPVNLHDLIRLEVGRGEVDKEEGSFDPKVDASRRSVGGEEDQSHYRFSKNLSPMEIIGLAKAALAEDNMEQGDANRSTPGSGEGTQMDE